MEKIIIKVDHEEVEEICHADALFNSACNIINKSLQNNLNIFTPYFENYEEKCAQYYVNFELLKSNLEKKYILSDARFADKKVNWSLDYASDELSIEIME